MVVCEPGRWLFVSVPKCGTNTLYQVLLDRFDAARVKPGFHRNQVPPAFADYYTWAVVRNPYARAVSLWWRTRHDPTARRILSEGPAELPAFIRWLMTGPEAAAKRSLDLSMSAWLQPVRLDRFCRLENLSAELSGLPFWDGRSVDLPRLNVGADRTGWRDYMTLDAVAAIQEWAGDDFERFGYSRELAG